MSRPPTGFRVTLLLILLAVTLALPASAYAADPAVEVLQVGWDGLVVPGSWSPVRVRLTGGSSDLSGVVEVVTQARYQPGGPQATAIDFPTGAYGQEITLPAGVVKEVTLWVPAEQNYGGPSMAPGSVRLLSRGQTVVEQRIEFRTAKTPFWPVMGVLADSPAVVRAIAQVELPVQGLPMPLSPARLAAADVPASAERLGALSALVVQGNAANSLTGEQRSAVEGWVRAGGHLVISGGPDAPRTLGVLPAASIPISFSGTDGSADLSGLSRWADPKAGTPSSGPAASFKATAGSLLAGTADRPLAWRMGLGQGTVTVLAADLGLEPLASWPGLPALLRKSLEPAIPTTSDLNDKILYLQMQQRDLTARMQGAVEALSPEAFPSWQMVALVLGGFLLVVGPLLHIFLWRTDRRVWAWVAVPGAALVLAGGMFFLGVGRDGRDVLVNVIGHVKLDPVSGVARQTLIAGFYAPTHSELTVAVPGEAAVRPGGNAGYEPYSSAIFGGPSVSSPSSEPPFRVVSGRDTRVEFASGQWGMRTVSFSRSLDSAGSMSATLELDGGVIKGSIRNDTPYPLEDAAVLMGQGVAKLGSLAPGQTAQVVLDPGRPANPYGGGFPISYKILGKPVSPGGSAQGAVVARSVSAVAPGVAMPAIAYPGGMPEQWEVPQDPEVQRRLRLLDPIINVPRMGPSAQSMPLTILAFTRAQVGKDLPSASGHPAFYLTLLEQQLRLDLPPGPFTMPPAMSPAEVSTQTGATGGGSNGTVSWMQIQNGSTTYSFRPPLPSRAKVDALVVKTQQMGPSTSAVSGKGIAPPLPSAQPIPAEPGVFSVYNWQSASWEPLQGGKDETRLQPGTPYLGPDGQVRLQVTAGVDKAVMFVQPELTVEGRMEQ